MNDYASIVRFIANNGCNKIKCKKCILQNLCSHRPDESKEVAQKILFNAMINTLRK